MFQSTPASEEAGDIRRLFGIMQDLDGFNPRPPPRRRATSIDHDRQRAGTVSIHARLRGGGRPELRADAARAWLAVSIHARLRGGGRPDVRLRASGRAVFQSTPASEEAGDAGVGDDCQACWFQSTPASEEAGDSTMPTCGSRHGRFNPRPPPRRRATASEWTAAWYFVSIHARLRGGGRPASSASKPVRAACFNPRPPPRRRATGNVFPALRCSSFNPRPPPRRRATARAARVECAAARFNPRPPPRRRATRARSVVMAVQRVSIHARLRGGGRHERVHGIALVAGFNPRPPPRRRATHAVDRCARPILVSIHARLRGGGRPCSSV